MRDRNPLFFPPPWPSRWQPCGGRPPQKAAQSVLAKRPYDLRHACVSTWLAAGVPSTQVAEWAGHSVDVLHRIYAKILAGQEASARERIERVLKLSEGPAASTGRPQTADDGRTDTDTAG